MNVQTDYLIETSDDTFGFEVLPQAELKLREAARGVIFNERGQIALLHVGAHGYHKLPGGGIDPGETREEALVREAKEEAGAVVEGDFTPVGASLEYRSQRGCRQVSYCFIAHSAGEPGELERTAREIEEQQLPLWVSLDKAISLLEADRPDDYIGTFVQVRDLAFLKEAQRILQKLEGIHEKA